VGTLGDTAVFVCCQPASMPLVGRERKQGVEARPRLPLIRQIEERPPRIGVRPQCLSRRGPATAGLQRPNTGTMRSYLCYFEVKPSKGGGGRPLAERSVLNVPCCSSATPRAPRPRRPLFSPASASFPLLPVTLITPSPVCHCPWQCLLVAPFWTPL